jgi:enterochelin esterase-like enzyme
MLILGATASAALAQAPAPAQSTVVRRSPFIPDCGPKPNPKIADAFCRAPLAFLYAEAERRLGSANLVYWTDGQRLNIAARSPTTHAELEGTIQEGLQPMSTIGSLWGATYQVPQLDKSLFEMRLSGQTGETLVYRGPRAPPPPPSNAVLKGRMEVVEIKSAALQATRKVTIYVPPGAAPKAGWPALITVGGAEIEPYLALIDALIEQKRIQPLVVVAVWDRPGEADGREYLRGKDPDAYIRHSMFVDREVMPIAVGRFGVTKDPARRLLFGVGDSGDWAVQTAARNPAMARSAAAFSVPGAAEAPFRQGRSLHLYMAAGAYEGPYLKGSRQTCSLASASGTPCVLEVAYAGHAPLIWQAELARVLRLVFPAR